MDEARRMAKDGIAEGAAIQADEQTAGRGRFGNQWSSPAGNLYMTVVFRPHALVRDCAQLSFVVAVALADTIKMDQLTLKWPNDVLVDRRKIAGILLEMETGVGAYPDFMLAGIGVNIASGPPGTAVYDGRSVIEVRDALLENLGRWYDIWQKNGFPEVRDAWLARAHGMHAPITVRMADNSLEGVFDGIDDAGNLILLEGGGLRRTIHSGAVHFKPGP
jgi:BirA family biotin operon repressor/biotin-[acetyl-CoA-carboxylase] ligase